MVKPRLWLVVGQLAELDVAVCIRTTTEIENVRNITVI